MSASFNDVLRAAAGHERREPLDPDRAGDVGIGRGGGSAARLTPSTNEQINDAIKLAARVATNRVDLDGVNLASIIG